MPFATANGIRLYYEWHGAEDGTPVVLVMGLGGDSTAWPFQLAALAPRHRVLVFDNRGAGQSDAPDARVHDPRHGRGSPRAPRRARRRARPSARAVARRRDRPGGRPGRARALREPPAPRDVGGTAPLLPARSSDAVRMARLQLGREGFYRALSVWLFTPECFASQPELVEMVVQRATHHPHPMALHAYLRQTEAVLGHDARDRLHLIRCPTLVAVGSQDLITPPLLAEELASRIPGARYRVLPDVGHGAIWEAPAAFNRRLPRLPRRGQTLTSDDSSHADAEAEARDRVGRDLTSRSPVLSSRLVPRPSVQAVRSSSRRGSPGGRFLPDQAAAALRPGRGHRSQGQGARPGRGHHRPRHGQPRPPTPRHIVDKLVEAAKNPRNHRYSASRGIRRLRVAIARWYRDRFGVELDPETETIATIGSKEGLAHLMLALLQPGDAVLVPEPGVSRSTPTRS